MKKVAKRLTHASRLTNLPSKYAEQQVNRQNAADESCRSVQYVAYEKLLTGFHTRGEEIAKPTPSHYQPAWG